MKKSRVRFSCLLIVFLNLSTLSSGWAGETPASQETKRKALKAVVDFLEKSDLPQSEKNRLCDLVYLASDQIRVTSGGYRFEHLPKLNEDSGPVVWYRYGWRAPDGLTWYDPGQKTRLHVQADGRTVTALEWAQEVCAESGKLRLPTPDEYEKLSEFMKEPNMNYGYRAATEILPSLENHLLTNDPEVIFSGGFGNFVSLSRFPRGYGFSLLCVAE